MTDFSDDPIMQWIYGEDPLSLQKEQDFIKRRIEAGLGVLDNYVIPPENKVEDIRVLHWGDKTFPMKEPLKVIPYNSKPVFFDASFVKED